MRRMDERARAEDAALVAALRAGDEAAFMALVERLQPQMLRIARMYVSTRAVAEEVVQEAWVGVLKGLHAFEGRSSLKSWMFRIAVYCAKTRRARDGRLVPVSTLEDDGDEGPAVDPDRFQPEGSRYANNWSQPPEAWAEERLQAAETAALVKAEIERLPPGQRTWITLRDVEGLSGEESARALGVGLAALKSRLHRARLGLKGRVGGILGRPVQGAAP